MEQKQTRIDSGRSMTEMLSVLAVIGVLSIGGLVGYKMLADKNRANNLYHDVQLAAFDAWDKGIANLPLNAAGNGAIEAYRLDPNDPQKPAGSAFAIQINGQVITKESCLDLLKRPYNEGYIIKVGDQTFDPQHPNYDVCEQYGELEKSNGILIRSAWAVKLKPTITIMLPPEPTEVVTPDVGTTTQTGAIPTDTQPAVTQQETTVVCRGTKYTDLDGNEQCCVKDENATINVWTSKFAGDDDNQVRKHCCPFGYSAYIDAFGKAQCCERTPVKDDDDIWRCPDDAISSASNGSNSTTANSANSSTDNNVEESIDNTQMSNSENATSGFGPIDYGCGTKYPEPCGKNKKDCWTEIISPVGSNKLTCCPKGTVGYSRVHEIGTYYFTAEGDMNSDISFTDDCCDLSKKSLQSIQGYPTQLMDARGGGYLCCEKNEVAYLKDGTFPECCAHNVVDIVGLPSYRGGKICCENANQAYWIESLGRAECCAGTVYENRKGELACCAGSDTEGNPYVVSGKTCCSPGNVEYQKANGEYGCCAGKVFGDMCCPKGTYSVVTRQNGVKACCRFKDPTCCTDLKKGKFCQMQGGLAGALGISEDEL